MIFGGRYVKIVLMKLVFFDIECACVHKTFAKICAFGYVVCDEDFNILEKEDILINPKGKFELTDRRGDKGLKLPYEYEEFKKHPPFRRVYGRIKELLEDKDALVFGHAVLNDVKYLKLETQRFKLPSFNFAFADSQLIYMTYKNDFTHQAGLEHIAQDLGVEFTPHRAVDDAYATMRIIEAICKAKNCGASRLLEELKFTPGKIEKYNIRSPQSARQKAYKNEKKSAKEARSRARITFHNTVFSKRPKKGAPLSGVQVIFARCIEDDLDLSLPLVNKLYEAGGRYAQKVDDCNICVHTEESEARTQKATTLGKRIMSLEEFKEYLDETSR